MKNNKTDPDNDFCDIPVFPKTRALCEGENDNN